jgi:hypothetical protein
MIGETYLATVYRVYTESDKSIKNDLEKILDNLNIIFY